MAWWWAITVVLWQAGTLTEITRHCLGIRFPVCGTPEAWWRGKCSNDNSATQSSRNDIVSPCCGVFSRLMAETDVLLYCDFHGHSRKNNVFMYGCNNRGDASLKLHERIFPLMMSKNARNKVHLYVVSRVFSKQSTFLIY